MRAATPLVLTAALLAGCASVADQAAQAEREADRLVQIYGPACDKLGYKRDTDAWRNCVLQLSMKDDLARYSNSYYGTPYFCNPWHPYRTCW